MSNNQVPIHIVIPTYNEVENITMLLEGIFDLGLPNTHVLIVDDDSPDGTFEIAKAFAETNEYSVSLLRRNGKEGLGTAYRDGFREVLRQISGKEVVVVQMDADHDARIQLTDDIGILMTYPQLDTVQKLSKGKGGEIDTMFDMVCECMKFMIVWTMHQKIRKLSLKV